MWVGGCLKKAKIFSKQWKNAQENIYYLPIYYICIFLSQDLCGHLDELIYYILLYAWIKLATIVTNPFDGDEHFDIDVIESIKGELYAASAALHF